MSAKTVVTRWWWVRHAPVTDHGGRLYGRTDVPANTSERKRFEALARALPEGAVWLTSALLRTHQTADAIAAAGHAVPARAEEPDLDEQDFGAWHGLTWEEVHAERGGLAHKYWVTPARVAPPEGESFVDVMERVAAGVGRRTARHAGSDIVAVAHGGSIRAALALALELDPERALAFSIDNLSITRIDHVDGPARGGAWRVVAVNLPAA